MKSQISQLLIVLGGMQVSRKLDWNDPSTLFYVRLLYVLSNVVLAGLYYFVYLRICKKNDLTTLKYVEAPQPLSGQTESPLITTTVREYDTQQLRSAVKGNLTGLAMMAVMHLYFQFSQPLLIQSVLPVKAALESNLFQVQMLNHPAIGDLKRPWKAASLFGTVPGSEAKTDKASIKKAEKETKVAAKDE